MKGWVALGQEPKRRGEGLVVGKVYELDLFHAERFTTTSTYDLTLDRFAATKSSCRTVCGDGIVAGREQCDKGPGKNVGGPNGCNPDGSLPGS